MRDAEPSALRKSSDFVAMMSSRACEMHACGVRTPLIFLLWVEGESWFALFLFFLGGDSWPLAALPHAAGPFAWSETAGG